ncbi:MAG: hypothetical protein ABIG64_03695 [Candidatus Omnitrophota bacterium]
MTQKYEKTIFICAVEKYSDIIKANKGCKRIYCGNEFCQYKFVHDVRFYKEIAKIKPISFVLPAIITPQYFGKMEKIIDELNSIQKDFELVINSFGMLEWYRQKKRKFPAVMGRMICHFTLLFKLPYRNGNSSEKDSLAQKKIIQVLDKNKVDFFKKNYDVNRFEISSLPHTHAYILPKYTKISLYYPYAVVTMTRNCVFRPEPEINTADKFCSRECGDLCLEVDHPASAEPFIMINNGYLIDCNIKSNKDIFSPEIDRFVRQIVK